MQTVNTLVLPCSEKLQVGGGRAVPAEQQPCGPRGSPLWSSERLPQFLGGSKHGQWALPGPWTLSFSGPLTPAQLAK